ncbi:MAG: hypothetical protein ACTSPB_21300 [Candidatus Thorarchaeota archaeon]
MAKKSKYIMDRPKFDLMKRTHKKHGHLVWGALHYAQYDMTDKQLKANCLKYAKNEKLDYKLLSVLSDAELAFSGKYATIIVEGGELPEDMEASFKNKIDELLVKAVALKSERKIEAAEKAKTTNTGPVLTVQDRMRIQAETLGAVFDQWVDDLMYGRVKTVSKVTMNPTKTMQAAGFKAGQARWIKKFYEPELLQIKDVLSDKDKELTEAYSHVSKSALVRVQKLLNNIVAEAAVVETVSNAQRKTRKKKAPSTEKLIAKLKYCVSAPELGIASVSPSGIIGASEIWIYNKKYRKLGKYVAQDAAGLTVKGTSIKDFNTSLSIQKTIRKPEQQLKDFMKSGKVKLRKFLSDIKAVDYKLNGRINNDVVILKIFK